MDERRAMGAGTHCDFVIHEERIAEVAGGPALQIQRNDRRALHAFSETSVESDSRDILDLVMEAESQFLQVPSDRCQSFLADVIQTGGKARQAMDILGAGLEKGRHLCRVLLIERMEAAAASKHRHEFQRPVSEADAPGALRAVESFMAGEAEDIDVLLHHVNGEDACALGGVDDESQVVLPAKSADPFQICGIAGDIGSMVDHDCTRSGSQQALEIRIKERPKFIDADKGQGSTLFFQLVKRTQGRRCAPSLS